MSAPTFTTKLFVERGDEEIELLITGTFYKGDKGCRTMANGDPGWPPTPAEWEVTATHQGVEIELTEKELEKAEEALWEAAESDFEEPEGRAD
jgi:hypothetical protein